MAVWQHNFAVQVRIRVEDQRQVSSPQPLHQSRQAQGVIGMTMAQDDSLKIVRFDLQSVQVVQQARLADPSVEQGRAG
jgi:hypothetical protein